MIDRFPPLATLGLALALGASACQDGSEPETSLEGLWLSEGYGTFVEIDSQGLAISEVTAVSCLPNNVELAVSSKESPGVWQLGLGEDPEFATLTLVSDATARLQPAGTASYRSFHRVTEPPPVCDRATEDTPLANFEVFWSTFREHYPFFELKGIDWDALGDSVRSQITAETTPEELFDLLAGMIAPLEDAHTRLAGGELERSFQGMRRDPQLAESASVEEATGVLEARFDRALEIVESQYLEGELRSFCNGHLRFGELPDGLVYLWLDQEGGYTDRPEFKAQLETLEAALDEVFEAAADARGLILDTRKNYGGSDIFSLALVSRLAGEEYLAYAKVARNDPDDPDRRTSQQEHYVPVSARPGFRGPVVQLIGPYTISAGETLTQALMGRRPQVTRVGESTQGVFSDVLGRRLPNGWQFGLPNELFLTADGESFDGPGIPPDVELPVFRPADLEAGRDPALDKAMELLGARE